MMNSRREIAALIAGTLLARTAGAQSKAPFRELARHPLTGEFSGMEAFLVQVTTPPGTPANVHRHPGFVLGYVLEGELRFAINDGSVQVIKAGETFFEPQGALHTGGGSASPNAPVRFLAFIVAPAGSPTSLPA